jgi:hypothetical protein
LTWSSSLLCSTFLANVAAGLACDRTNTWAAELGAAMHFVCPGQEWGQHMLQGLPIQVKPVVVAAQRAFRSLLHAHTGCPDADECTDRHSCKYNANMFWGGGEGGHDTLPIPAYVPALAPLSRKRAPARLRLSKAPIQTNLHLGVSYMQRLCEQGCVSAIDSEHHLLGSECLATEDVRAAFTDVLP